MIHETPTPIILLEQQYYKSRVKKTVPITMAWFFKMLNVALAIEGYLFIPIATECKKKEKTQVNIRFFSEDHPAISHKNKTPYNVWAFS